MAEKIGGVCKRHDCYFEEACRWCEPAKAVEAPLVGLEMAVPLPAQMVAAQQNAMAANAAACPTGFGVYGYMLCTFGGCMAPAVYGCKTCGVAGCANHTGIPHSPLRHHMAGTALP